MSFDTIWNSETQSFDKTKNLLDIDISWIEEGYTKIQEIKAMELADNEDNKVTIPSKLKEYFVEDNEETNKLEQFKKGLYEKLWLKTNLEENSEIEKFEKWFVDWLLIENMEMLISLTDKSLDELVQMIKELANWDVIVAIVEDLYDSMWDILETFKEPYNWWLALWWFWLWVVWKWMKWLNVIEKLSWNKNYDFLNDYKDVLWQDLTINDIVWEWNNALILKHPDKIDKVLKIAKPWRTDKLDVEFDNHMLFIKWLKELKKEYKWTMEWDILSHFNIPEIKSLNGIDGMYEMEKINWLSVKSIIHLDYYKNSLNNLPKDLYKWNFNENLIKFFEKNWLSKKEILRLKENWITDNDIKRFLENKWLKTYPEWKKFNKEQNKDYVQDLIRWRFTNDFRKNEIIPFKEVLEKNWYYHNDVHWWNIMIDENWKKYLIDFWNSEVK